MASPFDDPAHPFHDAADLAAEAIKPLVDNPHARAKAVANHADGLLDRLNQWLLSDRRTDADWLALGMLLGDVQSFLWDLSRRSE